jgi:methyltransferase (TIGR00027 family)
VREIKLSKTAKLIAESIYFLSSRQKFNPLIPRSSAELSRIFSENSVLRIHQTKFFRALRNSLLNRAIPGITLHYVLRKRRIEDFVRLAISKDFKQIVIIGAGFDTLGLRLGWEFPNIKFVEIDRFESQLEKVRTLKKHQILFPNLSFLSGDLEKTTLGKILQSSLFDPNLKTFFIAEGLLMYLSEEKVRDVFLAPL